MGVSSADPDDLESWVRASRALDEVLKFRRDNLLRLHGQLQSGTSWGGVDASSLLNGLTRYLELNESDALFVETVAKAFRDAGDGRRVPVPDAVIAAALRRAGVADGRESVTFDSPVAWGAPPTSGYASDPVNMASGNFVHSETDLVGTGLAEAVSWTRTYNSRSTLAGPHGRGWSSWASCRLQRSGDGLVWVSPEGQRVDLAQADLDDGRLPGVPGRVVGAGDGLALEWFGGGRWLFDADGRPVLLDHGPGTEVRLLHDAGRLVRLAHESGRVLNLEWVDDRLRLLRSSDGREVRYSYDSRGDLVQVDGPAGSFRYELDESGRVLAVVDADGVAEARNTYDGAGRVVEQESPAGRRSRFRYLPGRVTVFDDDSGGPRSSFVHDEAGRLIGIVDDHGAEMAKTYDEAGNPVAVIDRNGGTTVMEWDERNRLVRRVEPTGAQSRYAYDDRDRLVESVAADGGVTRLRYDGEERQPVEVVDAEDGRTRRQVRAGRVLELSDPDGVRVSFEHDADGNIVSVTDGAGGRTVLVRDATGQVTATVSPLGASTEVSRDAAGRPTEYRDATGRVWRYAYSAAGRPTATTDPVGATGVLRYGPHGRVEEVIDPLGASTGLRWDELGQLVGIVTPGGAKWEMRYDGLGRLVSTTDPAGAMWLRGYDAEGNLTSTVDPLGTQREVSVDRQARLLVVDDQASPVRLHVDAMGRLVRRERADGSAETREYDRCGRLIAVTDAAGGVTRYDYTPGGRLRAVTSPLGHRTTLGYDAAGRLVQVTDPAGGRATYGYDGDGRLVEVITPTGEREHRSYDAAGRLVAVTLPGRGTTRYTYDEAGRVSEVADAVGGVQRFRWDLRGQLVEAVDAKGGSTRYEYDELGLLAAVTDQLGGTTRRQYDQAGRLVSATDQLGRSTALGYDAGGRLTSRRAPGGAERYWRYDDNGALASWGGTDGPHVSVERDVLGRPVAFDEAGSRVELEWDVLDRLTGKRQSAGALAWSYDADGRQTAAVHPDGTSTSFEHDPAGRLSALHHPALGAVTMTRDAAGRLVSRQSSGGEERWNYQDGLLQQHHVERAGRVRTATLIRDVAGRVVQSVGEDGDRRYSYDTAGQLTAAAGAEGEWSWAYDSAGRLVSELAPSGRIAYGYDQAHQLVRVDRDGEVTDLAYDDDGQRVAQTGPDRSRRYEWDPLGRLRTVQEQRGQREDTWQLGFDPLGDLSEVNGTPILWDSTTFIPELRYVGTTAVVGQGWPLAAIDASDTVHWLDADWQSNVGQGHDPWGAGGQLLDLPGGLALGHRGELHLDGLVWLRDRTYDPVTRAFLSPDPLPALPGTTFAANPYHYAGNDPINALDPFGLQPLSDADFLAAREAMQTPIWDKAAALGKRAWHAGGGWSGMGHLVLDGVGLIPILGEPADAINAAWYLAEGDYTNAALSAAAMIPVAGWVATGGKFGVRGVRAVRSVDGARAWVKGRPSMVPLHADEIPFTPNAKFQSGQRYDWTDPATGKRVQYHAHGPDPMQPVTQNAGAGPIYRQRLGQHFLDAEGNKYTKNAVTPSSSAFNAQAANDTHIPFPKDQPPPGEPHVRVFVPNVAAASSAEGDSS